MAAEVQKDARRSYQYVLRLLLYSTNRRGGEVLQTTILPENVRLRPKTSDVYYWKTDPAVAHIFNKNLSKLLVGVYKELVYGVGRSFWAFSRSSGAQRD